jgi:hypothetical protein
MPINPMKPASAEQRKRVEVLKQKLANSTTRA